MQVESPLDLLKGALLQASGTAAFEGVKRARVEKRRYPAWLDRLTETHFFGACEEHAELKKNESTFFCQDCCTKFCTHCGPKHQGHAVIQIRRYVYCDVVRSADVQRFFDTGGIQMYTINSARVCFLHQKASQVVQAHKHAPVTHAPAPCRPDPHHPHGFQPSSCGTCGRAVREGAAFCSLVCKLKTDGTVPPAAAPAAAAATKAEQAALWGDAARAVYSSDEDGPCPPPISGQPLSAPTAVHAHATGFTSWPGYGGSGGLFRPDAHAPAHAPFSFSSSLPPTGYFPGIPTVSHPSMNARIPVPLVFGLQMGGHGAAAAAFSSPREPRFSLPLESPLALFQGAATWGPTGGHEGCEASAKRIRALTLESPAATREQLQHHLTHLEAACLPPAAAALPQGSAATQRRLLDINAPLCINVNLGPSIGFGIDSATSGGVTTLDRKRKGGSPRRSPLAEAPLAVMSLW